MIAKKIFSGTLITIGILLVMGAAGTSDYESEYLVPHPHPIWMLFGMALLGMLIVVAGYRICVPKYEYPP